MTRPPSPIVELRQYTLHPGAREVLIDLFDRLFVAGQEAVGMEVIGQFRDLGDADRFVWLRGFPDMVTRAQALAAFYGGPLWKANSQAANATMIDSDNVLLLRPARPSSAFDLGERRAPAGEVVVATIDSFDAPVADDAVSALERASRGVEVLGIYVTESSPNTFPRLPVREGEHVLLCFTRGAAAGELTGEWARRLSRPREALRLAPTSTSRLA